MYCKILTREMLHLQIDVLVEGCALDFFNAKKVANARARHDSDKLAAIVGHRACGRYPAAPLLVDADLFL
jgi:hypothetical protein